MPPLPTNELLIRPPERTIARSPAASVPPLTMPPDKTITVMLAGMLPDSVKPEPTSKVAPALSVALKVWLAPLPTNSRVPPERMPTLPLPPATATSRPPLLTVVVRPPPPGSTISVPPLCTIVLLTTVPLVSSNAPLLTTQAPPMPLTFQWPPTTLKLVKPLYCVPIELRSNVSDPVPPSRKALLPEASTSPLMI